MTCVAMSITTAWHSVKRDASYVDRSAYRVFTCRGGFTMGIKADQFYWPLLLFYHHRFAGFGATQKGSILGQRGLYRRGAV